MARRAYIQNLINTRIILRREDTRNIIGAQLDAIENSVVGPLPYPAALRPFMAPSNHNSFHIWKYILDWITDPQDIQNQWELCDLFRGILRPKYVQSRLPQVARLALDNDPVYSKTTTIRMLVYYCRDISLSVLELLKLRCISHLCKTSWEVLLQSKVFLSLDNVKQVQTIVNEIVGGEINPDLFCPGFLQVNEYDPLYHLQPGPELKVFSDLVGTLLELVGPRFKSFKYISKQSPAIAYENLRRWMPCLPNLRSLDVDIEGHAEPGEAIPSFEDMPVFPTCHQLQSLHQTCCKLPGVYVHQIIDANPLITSLTYPEWGLAGYMHPSDMNLRLEHLQCLHTPLYSALVGYLNYSMPLKEIIILQKWEYDGFGLEILTSEQLCTFLHQFRDTLEHLELRRNPITTREYILDLPNLKYFRLRYHDEWPQDLNMIVSSGRLHEVCMFVSDDLARKPQQFMDNFCERVTTRFGSFSMWQVFPGLKKFVAQFKDWQDEVSTTIEVCRPNNGIH